MSEPSRSERLRVWLEPGFDRRFGVWLVDLPGGFASGADESEALSNAPLAAWTFADRMREHGEPVDPGGDRPEVMESAPTHWLPDDYMVGACFGGEERPVSAADLKATLRRGDWMRQDLLRLLGRIEAFERRSGPLPGPDGARPVPEVLRHIAGVEIWLVSRLDGSARYQGPPRDGDPRTFLDGTHEWLMESLARLHERDPSIERTDGKGEQWTLAKVLRRFVYHAIDHLDELERRLDVAEGIAERLELRRDPPEADALADLLIAANLRRRAADRERLARMLAGTTETVSLYDNGRLVAFARVLTDRAYNAYVSTVAVHPRLQRRGVGRRVMRELMRGRDDIKWVLEARPGVERFYASLGYEPAPLAMVHKRRR